VNKQKWPITRRGIQLALGCLWLLDGLLQLQPQMFTSNFATGVIAPAAEGQPGLISVPMHFFMNLFLWQPALSNAGIAAVQIGLGLLILWKPTAKVGLMLSVAWGLFVWIVGEGLSGLASGHAILLMGSPGAALIYVLLALGILPKTQKANDQRPAYWLMIAWAAIWTVGSIYQVLPGQNTVADVSSMISTNAEAAPHWLAGVDNGVADYINHFGTATTPPASSMQGMPGMSMNQPTAIAVSSSTHQASGFWVLLLLALLQLIVAFAVFIPGFMRWLAVIIGSVLSIGFWVVGQSLGSYFTGLATDPNTGPLLVLLGIAILGCTQRDAKVRSYFGRLKHGFLVEIRALNEA
jgi:hypothetical protein